MLALARSSRSSSLRRSTSSPSSFASTSSLVTSSLSSPPLGRRHLETVPHGLVGGKRATSALEYDRPEHVEVERRAERRSPAAVFGTRQMPTISLPSELENKMERLFGSEFDLCCSPQSSRAGGNRARRNGQSSPNLSFPPSHFSPGRQTDPRNLPALPQQDKNSQVHCSSFKIKPPESAGSPTSTHQAETRPQPRSHARPRGSTPQAHASSDKQGTRLRPRFGNSSNSVRYHEEHHEGAKRQDGLE